MESSAAVLDRAPMRKLGISVSERQHRLLRQAVSVTPGVGGISVIIRRAIDTYLEQHGVTDNA